MGVKLLLIVAGIGIGIIATLIILRKDIFKVINYHDGLPDMRISTMSKQSDKIAWQKKLACQKTAIEISGIGYTDDWVVEVIIKATGKPASIRRDMAEFYPGRVFVPLWLAKRINPGERLS